MENIRDSHWGGKDTWKLWLYFWCIRISNGYSLL